MAKFTSFGTDELAAALQKAGDIPQEVVGSMLRNMAEVLFDAIRSGAISTAFMQHLTINSPKGNNITLTFKGTRNDYEHHNVREATIAFCNEYGVPSHGTPAREFMQRAVEKTKTTLIEAGQKVLDHWLDSCGL